MKNPVGIINLDHQTCEVKDVANDRLTSAFPSTGIDCWQFDPHEPYEPQIPDPLSWDEKRLDLPETHLLIYGGIFHAKDSIWVVFSDGKSCYITTLFTWISATSTAPSTTG